MWKLQTPSIYIEWCSSQSTEDHKQMTKLQFNHMCFVDVFMCIWKIVFMMCCREVGKISSVLIHSWLSVGHSKIVFVENAFYIQEAKQKSLFNEFWWSNEYLQDICNETLIVNKKVYPKVHKFSRKYLDSTKFTII